MLNAIKKISSSPLSSNYVKCAEENEVCNFNGEQIVYYGDIKENKFEKFLLKSPIICEGLTFGQEFYPNSKKSCYVPSSSIPINIPSDYVQCSTNGKTCEFTGTQDIYYGTNGNDTVKKTTINPIKCTGESFGVPNNDNGICYAPRNSVKPDNNLIYSTPEILNNMSSICSQDSPCDVDKNTDVYYGAWNINGGFKFVKKNVSNAIICGNDEFGIDPYPNVEKACYVNNNNTTPIMTIPIIDKQLLYPSDVIIFALILTIIVAIFGGVIYKIYKSTQSTQSD